MRKNKTKEKLKAGEPVFGFQISFPSPSIVEILGYAGADFVYLDTEHAATSHESLENMVRAAELSGTTSLVRVPQNVPGAYPGVLLRVLEIGAMGVIVPHVDTTEEAIAIVKSVKCYPEGNRGIERGRVTEYSFGGPISEYVKEANEENMIVIMIESVEGVKNLPQILEVGGIDAVQIGAGDLAQSMGYPGRIMEPIVQKTIDKIIVDTQRAGKAVGVGALSVREPERVKRYLNNGVRFINLMVSDLLGIAAQQWMDNLRKF